MSRTFAIAMCVKATCFVVLFFILLLNCIDARRQSPLLVEDDGRRNNHRAAECILGKQVRELGSTWYADLGPPFGVMYCIRCECAPIQKKRRIVARVQCRNIKNECPKPSCDEPVLYPGRCCKTCPGDLYSPDVLQQDIPQPTSSDEEERSMKHFATLLSGRTSMLLKREDMSTISNSNNPNNIVATGRFNFHKKNLYYSFYVSEKGSRPRVLQFIDYSGNILEEHNLLQNTGVSSLYQNATGKVCGVWRRVPKEYRRLLKDEQLYVALIWGNNKESNEFALSGQVARYTALGTELFSSLLEPAMGTNPEQMAGSGGTAIVSTSSGATPSIHLTLIVNGVFSPDETTEAPLTIRLELVEKNQIILEEIKRVRKPAHELNVIEVSSPVSPADLRLLTRGRLALTVESRRKPEALRLQGAVVTRTTCEIFQTAISSHEAQGPNGATTSSGLAWLYLNKDGALVYNVQVDELDLEQSPMITLVDDSGKRRTELEDLTPSLVNGKAIGYVDRLGPRVLEPLYSGDLAVNVATKVADSLVRGRLIPRPVADSRDSSSPILMKRPDISSPASLVGMAWLSVDSDCTLHFELTLSGLTHHNTMQLYLDEIPFVAPGAPVTRKLLEEFSTSYTEGSIMGIPLADLSRLGAGVCTLELVNKNKNETMLKATLNELQIPSICLLLPISDNDVPMSPSYSSNPNAMGHSETGSEGQSCFHSGRFYEEGEQWSSTSESCTICSCLHGRVKCDPIKCTPLQCRSVDVQIRKGECCSTCSNSTTNQESNSSTTRGCYMADQFYSAGSSWYPYLPPNGYDTCALCTCDLITLEMKCPRTQCPPLPCNDNVAYRPDKKACCKVCPEVSPEPVANPADPLTPQDQANFEVVRTKEQIIADGGCNYPVTGPFENGKEWHPWLPSHGEQKCVKCRCKDGSVKCDRKRCPRAACANQLFFKRNKGSNRDQLSAVNGERDECCASQCRRNRRHHNKNNMAAAAHVNHSQS